MATSLVRPTGRIETRGFCSEEQERFVLDERSPSLLFSGAFAAGKTRGLVLKTLYLATKYPGARIALVRKTFRSLHRTTLDTLAQELPAEWVYRHDRSTEERTLINGSLLIPVGCQDADRIGSMEVDCVAVDEAVELVERDWIMLQGRVDRGTAMPYGQVYAVTNPGTPSHFLYRWFFKEGLGRVIETETAHNTLLRPSYQARLAQFRGKFHERFVKGRWVSMEGLIYEGFNPAVHVVDGFPIPEDWPRFMAVDFGFNNAFAALWGALSPDDELYVYREIHYSQRLVRDHARQIAALERRSGNWDIPPERILDRWADHDAENRAQMEDLGLDTEPAVKEVSAGIQAVTARLEVSEVTGKPRLYVLRNALVERDPRADAFETPGSLVEEFQSYAWATTGEGKPDKEQPVKLHDHSLDALRYLVMGVKHRLVGMPFAFSGPARLRMP